jgi:hypothetical protein
MTDQDRPLRFKQITTRPVKQEKAPLKERIRKGSIPSPNHPWRGFKFGSHRYERAKPTLTPQNTVERPTQSEAQG